MSLAATLALAVWVLLATVTLNVVLDQRGQAQANAELVDRADSAMATVEVGAAGRVTVSDPSDDALLDAGTWIIAGGRILEQPPGNASLEPSVQAVAATPGRFLDVPGDKPLRLHSEAVRIDGRQVATVVTSLSLVPYQQSAHAVLVGSAVLAVVMVGAAYLVARASVTSALRPVQEMTSQAQEWVDVDVDRRFGPGPRPRELALLAATLDGWLARMSAMLRYEKQLVAEISHELRTPLSRILVEADHAEEATLSSAAGTGASPATPQSLEAAQSREAASALEAAQALAAIADSAREMEAILGTLLATARTEAGGLAGRCDAGQVVQGLARRAGEGARVRVVVQPPLPSVPAAGLDALVLERAVAPVLENALRHAATEVRIRVTNDDREVFVDVADDGPGVPDAVRDHVFEPGRRAAVGDDHGGAGLGLALARRLTTAAGGTISLLDTGQGATFRLALPRG
ncbi:ATP-binding protein [Oryzihumus sp.]